MAKRKTQHVNKNDEVVYRSAHSTNAGSGGIAEQLAKLGMVLESPAKVTK